MAPTMAVAENRMSSGQRMSHPSPGEEVLITGISGRFPNTDSVMELRDNLFNKVDMVSSDERRWRPIHPEIPQRTGKINRLNKFDPSFFGVNYKQAHAMDPMGRILLEKTYEAIIDAGVNPNELRNTKTGVFMAACHSEADKTLLYNKMQVNEYGISGCSRAVLASRISSWLGVTGPAYTVDSACSSSLHVLEHAFTAIRNGQCDAALIGGSNLCLHPYISLQYARLGVLSPEGKCRSFDNRGNGYVRSESIVVCFLQKAKDSRRVYAQVVHVKTNCDGYKEQSITYPSGPTQKMLMCELYEESNIQPSELEYIEAHATSTKAGDLEELKAIDETFSNYRSNPLLIGSIKSNLGHSESSSGFNSIAKLCIAYNTGYIPPNLFYLTPREGVPGLSEGRLQVVTEKTPWKRGLSAINNFGFGGANAHVLFKNIARDKVNKGLPSDDLPRLVCASGRTESAVAKILDELQSKTVDVEQVRLWHAIHDSNIDGHFVRGYTLLGSTSTKSISLARDIKHYSGVRRPVWFVYSGVGLQWAGIAAQLMRIPAFATTMKKCHKVLISKGVNLMKIITEPPSRSHENIVNSLVGAAAIQIGLTSVLKQIGVQPDYIIGHGIGELVCSYADNCLTLEQTILSAFNMGKALSEVRLIKGTMAIVELGYCKAKEMCPPTIEVACHNSPNFSTISGPAADMKSFIAELRAHGILVMEVPSFDIAYHSCYMTEAGTKLKQYLKEVIPSSTLRSERWVSTSIPKPQWKELKAKSLSAEYLVNNLLNPVLFEEASRLIHPNAVAIELAPESLLQVVLRNSLQDGAINVQLAHEGHNNNVEVLLTALGKLYQVGLNPHLDQIYPHVTLPVSQGTPMLAHLVEWDHRDDWYTPSHKYLEKAKCGERTVKFSLKGEDSEYMSGHAVDGRNLYPGAGYLLLVWKTLSKIIGERHTALSVVFENVRFKRATSIPKEGKLEFIITVQKGSGNFEIVESETSIVTGCVYAMKNVGQGYTPLPPPPEACDPNYKHMRTKDFYKELQLRGYEYSDTFCGVVDSNVEGTHSRVLWENNWVTFLDNMLQMSLIAQDTRTLAVPIRIDRLSIDTVLHYQAVSNINNNFDTKTLEVRLYPDVGTIRSVGVEIRGVHTTPISKRIPPEVPILEKQEFISNFGKYTMKIEDALRVHIHLAIENIQSFKVKCIELVDDEYKTHGFEPVMMTVANILEDIALIQIELVVISKGHQIQMPSNISVENKELSNESNATAIIGANLLQRPDVLRDSLWTLREGGFVISRETERPEPKEYFGKFDIISIQKTGTEYLVMFRKRVGPKPTQFIKIVTADETFSWIDKVKQALKKEQKLVLYSQGEEVNGLLGFVNCLKKEPGCEIVYALLIADPAAPPFNPDLKIYKEQLDKGLFINVLQDGDWGTYRYLLLRELESGKVTHGYMSTSSIGDLSSIKWIEGPLRKDHIFANKNNVLIQVYNASLNFRDFLIAAGRVTADPVGYGRLAEECMQGFEVVGRTPNGSRVMAMVRHRGLSNLVEVEPTFMFSIPDEWTFEEAATVPVAYLTAYYALLMTGQMQRGETVLIHSGSGGVGQAAINLALHYGCEVFTTVGSARKRTLIKKLFPQLEDSHIGNSRDTSFERMIRTRTKDKGVDLVLNSLTEDKLQASVRCLKDQGRFIEIGKYDIDRNTLIDMCCVDKEISFHGVYLFSFFDHTQHGVVKRLRELITCGIASGAVRPLTYCKFDKHEVETAVRYISAGKHIGKVIIKISDEETSTQSIKPTYRPVDAIPRYLCHEDHVYVIVGGLGGFGLELADWLIIRGARKLVLNSRRGITNGYQGSRLRAWSSYGTDVRISTHDVTTEAECEEMLRMANEMGRVTAIFNLAMVLKESIFQNQTPETFKMTFAPKAFITRHLDKLSQELCPGLKDFVVFSSTSCGRGSPGLTNYGMANSVMERICERRKRLGLPALAVQWGAIGDVGVVAESYKDEEQIGGTLRQGISSCLHSLDNFLKQDAPIVSSIIKAEEVTSCESVVEVVAKIMSIRDLKTVSLQAPLAELGMDSMTVVEIKQILARKFEIFLAVEEIRTLSFSRLLTLSGPNNGTVSASETGLATTNAAITLAVVKGKK